MRWLIPLLAPVAATLILAFGLLIWLGDDTDQGVQRARLQLGDRSAAFSTRSPGATRSTRPARRTPASSRACPAGERHVPKGDVLFGVFVTRTNSADATLPSASRIDLLDGLGRAHRPLRLSPRNPYTYAPGTIAPGGQLPAPGTRRGRRHRREWPAAALPRPRPASRQRVAGTRRSRPAPPGRRRLRPTVSKERVHDRGRRSSLRRRPRGAPGSAPGEKGLKANAISYVSNVVIATASTAPAYSLAATLGFIVAVPAWASPPPRSCSCRSSRCSASRSPTSG